ncbi:MAG TPA: bifunctional chorismate mutase/prephenate dehydrogenase [Verrucomicrobiota bacterium]|nr:bifunctional chorismate mutase/prephenate dehydrogenase [Verrucomicrobiota bacterium]HNU53311.1 bifunctional chorismate mutase/prephenate dehydrogenase [Verrucomicrobiota bacterium]
MNDEPSAVAGAGERDPVSVLDALRREIDAIDEQIVDLLGRRQAMTQSAVAIKTAAGLPVYHPAREENLISQRRDQARRAGLDPQHVEELYRCIIRQSRMQQTVHAAQAGVRPGARVLLVGGRGQMGQYFARWLGEAGYEVRVLDVDDWPEAPSLCAGIDLAIVGVPIRRTPEVIAELGPHLPPQCVLADITSVKSGPLAAMMAAHSGPVLGLHPLFGPSTSSMDQQIVVATPGRNPEACRWVVDQLTGWGNIVMTISASEHDEIMDLVQGLRHFATFTLGRFLALRQVNLGRTLEFSSPIYRLEMGMVGRLFAQDPALYAGIILASPERRALLREYVQSLTGAQAVLDTGDGEAFCREFRRIAQWFGPFCEQAMRESTFLIDKLVERF